MVWVVLSPTRAHVAYAVVAMFSIFFSLFSLFIKEKMYLGEAPLATLYGLIVGPHCLDWLNPLTWGNWMSITLEISRVLLCIEIVAVAVELPRKYILKHWWSVFLLLIPCMTAGFLVIGLFIWAILPGISFPEGLLISACITATDPVLAQAVVGKGKFAQRVPAHLRNLLNAESACNDGISVPFVYLALNLIVHAGNSKLIAKNFICITVLYECVFGCILGTTIGYVGRRLLKIAEQKHLIDAEPFLAFYIMLAILCAGFGSILGCDDLLASFCAGTAFAWDGWFTAKTEESHVSTVIDLLLNLSYFVYFGSIIPWQEFNDHWLGLDCWRLVCIAICVLACRRIPAVMTIKRFCPDINNWKEALFVGHFGPIGVGAVYTSIVAIAELEAESLHINEGPTMDYPDTHTYYRLIRIVWPCVSFLIVTSIIVHGTSVAVIVLGRHLQSMSFTLTFTRTETLGGGWTTRLPRKDKNGNSVLRHVDKDFEEEDLDEAELSDSSLQGVTARPAGLRRGAKRRRRRRRKVGAGRRKTKAEHEKSLNEKEPETLKLSLGPREEPLSPSETESSYSASSYSTYSSEEGPVANNAVESSGSLVSIASSQRLGMSEKGGLEEETNAVTTSSSEPSPQMSTKMHLAARGADHDEALQESGERGTIEEPVVFSNPHAKMITSIRGNPELMDKLRRNYEFTDEDLEPSYQDGEFRVPTRGYRDGNQLIIEDQHGEILHRLTNLHPDSDQESITSLSSLRSMASLQSLKRTFSKLGSKLGMSIPEHGEENEPDRSIGAMLHGAQSEPGEVLQSLEEAVDSSGRSDVSPPENRVVKTVTPDHPKHSLVQAAASAVGRKDKLRERIKSLRNDHPRRLHISEKLHGFRINDTIIIEDRDGNVVATYKINPKKDTFTRAKPDDLLTKALQAVGLARQEGAESDLEKNLKSSATLIPEANTIDDKRIEGKLRAFIKNPDKLRMTESDARKAARNYAAEHGEAEDEDYDDDDDDDAEDVEEEEIEDEEKKQREEERNEGVEEPEGLSESEGEEEAPEGFDDSGELDKPESSEDHDQRSGASSMTQEEERDERVAREAIEKQKEEDGARRRRREGSSARRLRRGTRRGVGGNGSPSKPGSRRNTITKQRPHND
ncbi:DEKNAAC104498 [Brettanomyces naardenensis]|uniref:DEKNAAC104498 n=1 Tax=Brettanomyces naardenensis TaxID=13370 RepID=A0A448YR70_BRENA|nr:DEKNAAC104498 [Brettanomyces naardenensis]